MNKKETMSILGCSVDNSSLNITGNSSFITDSGTNNNNLFYDGTGTCWNYWQEYYYPQVIRESYPVYIQERAKDKGKQAFEIIKMLSDKKMIKMDKVKDFINVMDLLIKIL